MQIETANAIRWVIKMLAIFNRDRERKRERWGRKKGSEADRVAREMSQQEGGRKNVQVTTAAAVAARAGAARMWPEQRVTTPQGRRNASTTRRAHNQQGRGRGCAACYVAPADESEKMTFLLFASNFVATCNLCKSQMLICGQLRQAAFPACPAPSAYPASLAVRGKRGAAEGQTYIDLVWYLPRSEGVHFMYLAGGIPWKKKVTK